MQDLFDIQDGDDLNLNVGHLLHAHSVQDLPGPGTHRLNHTACKQARPRTLLMHMGLNPNP